VLAIHPDFANWEKRRICDHVYHDGCRYTEWMYGMGMGRSLGIGVFLFDFNREYHAQVLSGCDNSSLALV
jgi:hypothetical protein